jgi:heme/copper-type cytochrome/quinol oxidase subunit 2
LIDILTKREHLTRDYYFAQKNIVYLSPFQTATPKNPLLKAIIKSHRLEDPSTFSSEYSRDYIYSSIQYFKFLQLKSQLALSVSKNQKLPINPALVNEYILFYFLFNDTPDLVKSHTSFKSQFRPLRKGVNSMLRLHATGAVAMPIEIRLQILASSKDVIHSWSIPAAGIKIDCIPGYTSHRIMKFMLTGIYWGQCQEICGRYHH